MPRELIDALKARKLVIFAGAGVSTDSRHAHNKSFYERIRNDLGVEPDKAPSFPELMSQYVAAKGRIGLLNEVKKHMEYGNLFSEVYVAATEFHRELATIPFLDEIFTTNWDDSFETVCNATPYVTADDFAFWELPGRKVVKLHGSIHNVGSLVITKDDYDRCYRRLRDGLIGSTLKLALATKTIVFIGYSMGDPDLARIWKLVRDELGELIPTAYWVTLKPTTTSQSKSPTGLRIIETDASYFLLKLKEALVDEGVMLPDERWMYTGLLRERVAIEHRRLHHHFRIDRHPEIIFSAFYQDGIMHACDAVVSRAFAGEASHKCFFTQSLKTYRDILDERLRSRMYGDVAYIQGYMNGLLYPALEKEQRERIPLYFLFGRVGEIRSFSQYRKLRSRAPTLHKSSYQWAKKAAAKYQDANGSVSIHHRPFL